MASESKMRLLECFRALNEKSPILVLPGAWDFVSARMFADEGFPAIGTTSTGMCWSIGRSKGWESFLSASNRIVRAVDIPVSLDIEAGFSETAEGVADHVQQAIEIGACGINLEDGLAEGRLGAPAVLVEKIRSIRELCSQSAYPLYLNARTDVFLGGGDDLAEAIRRGQLYSEAGADMFFVPGLANAEKIATLVDEVPAPVNIYAGPGVPLVDQLADIGVQRLSIGCGILQSALADARRMTRALVESGSYAFARDWLPYEDLEGLCSD